MLKKKKNRGATKQHLWLLAAKLAKQRAMLAEAADGHHAELTAAERLKLEAEAAEAQLALDMAAAQIKRRKSMELIGAATQKRLETNEKLSKVQAKEAKVREGFFSSYCATQMSPVV